MDNSEQKQLSRTAVLAERLNRATGIARELLQIECAVGSENVEISNDEFDDIGNFKITIDTRAVLPVLEEMREQKSNQLSFLIDEIGVM